MNLIEAIKSGKPYRRKFWNQGNGQWRGPVDFKTQWGHPVCERLDDLTADDWEIQEPTATITKRQLYDAYSAVLKENNELSYWARAEIIQGIARKLGLED